MKQDKADKIIKKAELKAKKAAQQVQVASKKAEAAKQKQAAQAQKKAAKAADAATKKAASKTKKAEAAAKKAQLAAKKAEEKKAKALAKVAAKAAASDPSGEGGEGGGAAGKKKGKKKLLLIAVPVLAAAVGVGAFFFLRGGGEEEEEGPPEPIAAPAAYVLNEQQIPALPVWGEGVLVYQEEVEPEPAAGPGDGEGGEGSEGGDASPLGDKAEAGGEGGDAGDAGEGGDAGDSGDTGESGDASGAGDAEPAETEPEEAADAFKKILYRYEGLQAPADLISAYITLMTMEDAGFSTVDETPLRIDPPEAFGTHGTVQLARNVPETEEGTGGGVQSLLLSWEGSDCSVLLDMPEGLVHDPAPEREMPVARKGISDIEALHPSVLGLPGESMEAYELMPKEGSVRIADSVAVRVDIYDEDSQIVGSYFLSQNGKLYKLDESLNAVVELEWE